MTLVQRKKKLIHQLNNMSTDRVSKTAVIRICNFIITQSCMNYMMYTTKIYLMALCNTMPH